MHGCDIKGAFVCVRYQGDESRVVRAYESAGGVRMFVYVRSVLVHGSAWGTKVHGPV